MPVTKQDNSPGLLSIMNVAKLLAPNDDDIEFNLEIANQHVVDAIVPLPKVFFIRWWHNLVNKFSADGWAKISVFTFILTLILAGFFFFTSSSRLKRTSFWIGILILAISIFSYNFAARQEKTDDRTPVRHYHATQCDCKKFTFRRRNQPVSDT